MGEATIYLRVSRTAVRYVVSALPKTARAGGAIADAMMTRCGMAALGRIKQAFVLKARGGTDEAGDKWQPLSPKTIAYSKTRQRGSGGRTKAEKERAAHPSQALTQRQQSRWWEVYRRYLAIYKGNKGHAAAVAWTILKKEGATILLDKYGHRKVEILRDTGLLLNSLSPGVVSSNSIFHVGPGSVIVGTNRAGAAAHHAGVPGRLPQRRLWPSPDRWPQSWWRDIDEQAIQGLIDLAVFLLKGVAG